MSSGGFTLPTGDSDWNIIKAWEAHPTHANLYQFSASNSSLPNLCEKNPSNFLVFPQVIQTTQRVLLDGNIIDTHGSPDLSQIKSYFGAPVISCARLQHGKTLQWQVFSSGGYFARVKSYPIITTSLPSAPFFNETLNIIAAGTLLLLAVVILAVFYNVVSNTLCFSLSASSVLLAGYFLSTTPYYFNISLSMQTLHKFGDICLWSGFLLFVNSLRLSKLLGKQLFVIYTLIIIAACIVILNSGQNLDIAQLGTTIPFIFTYLILFVCFYHSLVSLVKSRFKLHSIFLTMSLLIYIMAAINDMLVVGGDIQGHMILSVGIISGMIFFMLSIHQNIRKAYAERDYLRENLEQEVQKKTQALEKAMIDIKSTQSELVQSAKLASLGTLSAGIAHEINNSLNFVNGAVKPLKKIVNETEHLPKRKKAETLLNAMQEGLKLTFDIINSLRQYTGQNASRNKSFKVDAVINNILTILKSRLHNVTIDLDIADINLQTDIVAVNQIIMNLISNALDAMERPARLKIAAINEGENMIAIHIEDSGPGIPEETLPNIFDPFFTTKDVGQGSGLGLHIVRKELDNIGGTIQVRNATPHGSIFTVRLPTRRLA